MAEEFTNNSTDAESRQEQITAWLTKLVEPGSVVELRALNVKREKGWPATYCGFYDADHLADMARAAFGLDQHADGVYLTLNPLDHRLHSRRKNHCNIAKREQPASDKDVLRRRWLLIDCDPSRPAGISSTDEELKRAEETANEIDAFLFDEQCWPAPVRAMSGNGFHLLYRIDLPADDGGLVKRFLESLSSMFSGDEVKIDTAVFNPSRICKLYGTYARKGDSTAERPHRLSKITHIPDELAVVTREQLEHVAAMMPMPAAMVGCSSGSVPSSATSPKPASTSVVNRARNYLATVPPAISGQGGSKATFRAACVLVKNFALSIDDALPLLSEWNARCEPPWTESELLHKLNDAAKAAGEVGKFLKDAPSPASTPASPPSSQPSVVGSGKEKKAAAILPAGTKVRAKDRDNFGEVVRDDGGQMVSVHFVSPEGNATTVPLPREQLTFPDGSSVVPPDFQLNLMTSAEFMAADFRQHFLIKRLLVEGQPCILGGPKKVLKTSLLVDLAVSLGTGTPFLGQPEFAADHVNVMLLSGESGDYTLQETARRIALARGWLPSTLSVSWGFDLPQLSEPSHLAELAGAIERCSAKVAIIDPAYLCLLSAGSNANVTSNVFAMGQLLKGVTEVGQQTGCTIIIAHHTRKADRQSPYGVPDLEDLSGSGFAEWARQWILLNRREQYQSDGKHALWLTVGGSAGHSGTWTLDIDEGVVTDEAQQRTWKTKLTPAADAIADMKRAKEERQEQQKAKKGAAAALRHCQAVRDVLAAAAKPMTKSAIKDLAGLSGSNVGPTLHQLITLGEVREVENPQSKYLHFELVKGDAGQVGQPGQLAGHRPPVREVGVAGQLSPLIGGSCPCPTDLPPDNQTKEGCRTTQRPLFGDRESAA